MTILPISLYLNIPSEVASVIKEDKYEYLSKSSTQLNHYENRSIKNHCKAAITQKEWNSFKVCQRLPAFGVSIFSAASFTGMTYFIHSKMA
jgi:hypothetical protein